MLEKVCREKEGGIGKKKSFPVTASEKGKNSARTPKMGGMGEGVNRQSTEDLWGSEHTLYDTVTVGTYLSKPTEGQQRQ